MSPFRQHAKKTRELWWQGLPPSVRGKVWKLAIGNDLHITQGWFSLLAIVNSWIDYNCTYWLSVVTFFPELFDIFQSHAYEKLFTTRLNKQKNVTQTVAELPASDHPVVSKAHTVELIVMDVSRTFPSLCIFQEVIVLPCIFITSAEVLLLPWNSHLSTTQVNFWEN